MRKGIATEVTKLATGIVQPLAEAHAKADQAWRTQEEARLYQEKVLEYDVTYPAVCEVLAPILRRNAPALDIITPLDPLAVAEDPPLYYDRGAIFYRIRVDKRGSNPDMQGSRLKYRLNQQLKVYCKANGRTLPLSYVQLLSLLRVVTVRDLGYEYILHIGRVDDPSTARYIQALQVQHRSPADRNMI